MNQENKKDINKSRIFFSILYFLLPIVLVPLFWTDMVYPQALQNSWNLGRFFWCCLCSSFGFSGIAFHFRRNEKSPFPEYVSHYPFQLLAMSALIFSLLHLLERTSSYLFYYLSGSLCFTLGFMADSYWVFIKAIIQKAKFS